MNQLIHDCLLLKIKAIEMHSEYKKHNQIFFKQARDKYIEDFKNAMKHINDLVQSIESSE